MEKVKTDRRVKYTKRVLQETMIDLLKEQNISKISVKKICEIADVNRSTFYAYYADPYDLLSQIERETIQDINAFILRESWRAETTRDSLCILLEYAARNADLFKILINEKSEISFRTEIMKLVRNLELTENRLGFKPSPRIMEYINLYTITGILSMMDKWLGEGMLEPIGEMADLISGLTCISKTDFEDSL